MTNACTITEPMSAIAPPMTNSIAAEYGGKRRIVSRPLNCLGRGFWNAEEAASMAETVIAELS
jgi:hypothetical protein